MHTPALVLGITFTFWAFSSQSYPTCITLTMAVSFNYKVNTNHKRPTIQYKVQSLGTARLSRLFFFKDGCEPLRAEEKTNHLVTALQSLLVL